MSSKTHLLLVAPSAGLKHPNIGTTEVSNSSSETFNFFTSKCTLFLFENASKYCTCMYPKIIRFEHHSSISARTPSGGLPAYNMHFKKCLHFNEEAFNLFSQKISTIFSPKTRHAYFAMSENDLFFVRSTFCMQISNCTTFMGENVRA